MLSGSARHTPSLPTLASWAGQLTAGAQQSWELMSIDGVSNTLDEVYGCQMASLGKMDSLGTGPWVLSNMGNKWLCG